MAPLFHPHIANIVGIIALAIWLHLFFGRGWFWRVRKPNADATAEETLAEWPNVMAVIPARNEAETIGRVVTSLVEQNYPGELSLTIVDDHSEDATAAVARQSAEASGAGKRVSIVSAPALAPGWTGKLSALNAGLSRVEVPQGAALSESRSDTPDSAAASSADQAPSFYWFTDADVIHAPDTLRRLVVRAERDKLDLASLMVLLQAKTFPERALIPAFLYFFLMLYPPQWIADDELSTAGAAGGCILLKREALARMGGLAAIKGEVIDDCALAKAVKSSGGTVWMGLARKSTSLRAYKTFGEIRDLIARTAFTQLRYSSMLLAGTLAGMFLTYVAPLVLLFAHDSTAQILGLVAWLLMSLSFLPTVRFYRLSPLWAPFLPLAALFYTYATWLSAVRYWLGKGGQWKGRAQAPKGV
jgi:hopene-associated glycosyltransferase HpnB